MARRTKAVKEEAELVAELVHTLEHQPEEWLACRDLRHAWDSKYKWRVYPMEGTKELHIARDLECLRCGCMRVEVFIQHRATTRLERIYVHYAHPEGYLLKRVPKGVVTKHLVTDVLHERAIKAVNNLRKGS